MIVRPAPRRRTSLALATAVTAAALLACLPGRAFALQDAAPPSPTDAPAATAPAAGGEAAEAMTVIINEVKGLVQVRGSAGEPWKKAAPGMEVTAGAEFRTGPKSSVVCTIPPDQTIVLDRLGTVKIAEAMQTGTKVKTDLVMKYGRTDYAIEAAGREHESTIRSPSSTLAVRGTSVSLYDQPPFTPQAQTFTGQATYRYAKRQMGVGKGGKARGARGSAETALVESVVDPNVAAARTESESSLIASEVSRGAILTYEPNVDIPVVRGGPGPRTDAELVRTLPGVLNFVVRWQGNADVDIVTTVQRGDPLQTLLGNVFVPETVIYPGFGLETSSSGGRIALNHRGGPNGGQEISFWPGQFPAAVYGLAALNNSADTTADVRFNAYLGDEKLTLYSFDEGGALVRSKGFRRDVAPDATESTVVLVPPVPALEDPTFGAPEVPDETLDAAAVAAAGSTARKLAPKNARETARAMKLTRKQERRRETRVKAFSGARQSKPVGRKR